ncbi:MAG TPA: CHAD domain-containing protein [Candidatus Angelobacter sp.]|nr:CHAD domain-containing protein [Candidatus Angelobacter sp.]
MSSMPSPQKRIEVLAEDLFQSVSMLGRESSAKNVDGLRIAARRLETLIAFVCPNPSKKQERTLAELSGLRKRAGKVRDLDAAAGLLETTGNGSAAMDRRELRLVLHEKRERQARRLLDAAGRFEITKLTDAMLSAGKKNCQASFDIQKRDIQKEQNTPQKDAQENCNPLARAKAELVLFVAEVETLLQAKSGELKPKRLHQIRVRLKGVRYLAEAAAPSQGQPKFLESVKSLQDALEEWRDWQILAKAAEKQFAGRINCPLLVEIRAVVESKYAAAASAAAHMAPHPVAMKRNPRSVRSEQAVPRQA